MDVENFVGVALERRGELDARELVPVVLLFDACGLRHLPGQ